MSDGADPVVIQINGEPRSVAGNQGLAALIAELGLPPQATLVEHNGLALFRKDWDGLRLTEGDRLEILRVVAGG